MRTTARFDISTSTQANLQLENAPTDPPTAATVYQSLFQFNLFGIRVHALA
jgi:hypothetical protein